MPILLKMSWAQGPLHLEEPNIQSQKQKTPSFAGSDPFWAMLWSPTLSLPAFLPWVGLQNLQGKEVEGQPQREKPHCSVHAAEKQNQA